MTDDAPAVDRSAWAGYAIRAALTLVILGGLITILGDERLPGIVAEVAIGAFVASFLLNVIASIVLPAVVSYLSAKRTEVEIGLMRFVVINFTIRFYTLILPRASATGVRWLKYRKAGSGAAAAALVVLEKLVQVFTYAVVAATFVFIERDALGGAGPAVVAIAAALVLASGVGLAALFTDRIDPLLRPLGFITRLPLIGPLAERVVSAVVSQRGWPPREIAALAGWSAVGYGFFVASAWVIADQLAIDVSVPALAWIRGLVFLGTLIPITIAGAGIREAGFVGFLSIYGVDKSTALGFALALFGVQIAIGTVGGLLELTGSLFNRSDRQKRSELTRGKEHTAR